MRFAYRLAAAMHEPDVEGMLASMSWSQLAGWVAFSQLEPIGERRADLRSALVSATLLNINRDTKHKREPYTVEDCLLPFPGLMLDEGKAKRGGRAKPLDRRAEWKQMSAALKAGAGGRGEVH